MKVPCHSDECKIMKIQEVLFGKWKLSILWFIYKENIKNFNALQRIIKQISHKVLAEALSELVEDGILTKTVYESKEPKTEYNLTAIGLKLMPIIEEVEDWVIESYYSDEAIIRK